MKCVDDFRLRFGRQELVPIVIGGMGVDISTAELALEVARLGGIGHISDAMVQTVSDRRFDTKFVSEKLKKYKTNAASSDKSNVHFNLAVLEEATRYHVGRTMEAKRGDGMIFINCMEKLTMNAPRETLRMRLSAALDALAMFLRKNARLQRLPDYVVVEGPLAGGHLGFGIEDWAKYDLATLVGEVLTYLKAEHLDIPVIAAGGIFTGSDAAAFLELGAAAVQVATRFTVTRECGLPDKVKQEYFKANEHDIEVNTISPTGYPMRMLKGSPGIGAGIRPNCEAYGYLLDAHSRCAYIDAYNREVELHPTAKKVKVMDKTCLCTHMRNFDIWTCGHTAYRLKDTTLRLPDGSYQVLSAAHVFHDYQFSVDQKIALPPGV